MWWTSRHHVFINISAALYFSAAPILIIGCAINLFQRRRQVVIVIGITLRSLVIHSSLGTTPNCVGKCWLEIGITVKIVQRSVSNVRSVVILVHTSLAIFTSTAIVTLIENDAVGTINQVKALSLFLLFGSSPRCRCAEPFRSWLGLRRSGRSLEGRRLLCLLGTNERLTFFLRL